MSTESVPTKIAQKNPDGPPIEINRWAFRFFAGFAATVMLSITSGFSVWLTSMYHQTQQNTQDIAILKSQGTEQKQQMKELKADVDGVRLQVEHLNGKVERLDGKQDQILDLLKREKK